MISTIIHKEFDDILQLNIEDSKSPIRIHYQLDYKYDTKTSINE